MDWSTPMEVSSLSLAVWLSGQTRHQHWLAVNIASFRSRAGQFIGAIGVSGGTVEADLEIARAAAAAVAAL